jgi:hypothetical protein
MLSRCCRHEALVNQGFELVNARGSQRNGLRSLRNFSNWSGNNADVSFQWSSITRSALFNHKFAVRLGREKRTEIRCRSPLLRSKVDIMKRLLKLPDASGVGAQTAIHHRRER